MDSDTPWPHLVHYKLNVFHKLTIFEPVWCEEQIAKITNAFWMDVLDSCQKVPESCSINSMVLYIAHCGTIKA